MSPKGGTNEAQEVPYTPREPKGKRQKLEQDQTDINEEDGTEKTPRCWMQTLPQVTTEHVDRSSHTAAAPQTPWHVAQVMQGGGGLQESTTPFCGHIRGTTWNSQALFANDHYKHNEK